MKKYSESHEWIELESEAIVRVGLSDHAQHLLGDIAFLELPTLGAIFKQGEALGVVESVKAASDFYSPVSGTVMAVNEAVCNQPEALNGQADSTWLVKLALTNPNELSGLMTASEYQQALAAI